MACCVSQPTVMPDSARRHVKQALKRHSMLVIRGSCAWSGAVIAPPLFVSLRKHRLVVARMLVIVPCHLSSCM
jgi:hypothetical protein